jgi:hypothetical protein
LLRGLVFPSKILNLKSLQNSFLCLMCMDDFSLILYVSAAVIFCHNFSVKLFSDNSPRVYCLSHLEVIFRSEIRCIKIDMVSELRLEEREGVIS